MSNVHDVLPAAKTILAVDLGKFKSVACVLDVAAGTHRVETIPTNPVSVHDLLAADHRPRSGPAAAGAGAGGVGDAAA